MENKTHLTDEYILSFSFSIAVVLTWIKTRGVNIEQNRCDDAEYMRGVAERVLNKMDIEFTQAPKYDHQL